ncbi:MAG TPA: hypothetical protein VK254_03555 [Candidatus Bathyarchaeia archaeon]|nr:hypothetical protein [Candidatus Bathyarchaeia archaeon]
MKIYLTPESASGKWSIGLIAVLLFLFSAGASLASFFYKSVPAGNTLLADIVARPILAISMLLAMLSGVLSFITGLVAIIKQKERALLVYISVAIGALLILLLLGEFLFPH